MSNAPVQHCAVMHNNNIISNISQTIVLDIEHLHDINVGISGRDGPIKVIVRDVPAFTASMVSAYA